AAATNANLFVIYLGEFIPAAQSPWAARLVLGAILLPLAIINMVGVKQGARMSTALIVGKLLPIAVFLLAGLALAVPHPVASVTVMPQGAKPWLDTILLLMFAYGGVPRVARPL